MNDPADRQRGAAKLFLDFETFERAPVGKSYLIAAPETVPNATPDAPSPTFRADVETLLNRIRAHAIEQKWRNIGMSVSQRSFHATAVSPILGLKDDIDITVFPDAAGSTLAAYSRSQTRRPDFDANRNRLDALMAALHKEEVLAEGEGGLTMKHPGHTEV